MSIEQEQRGWSRVTALNCFPKVVPTQHTAQWFACGDPVSDLVAIFAGLKKLHTCGFLNPPFNDIRHRESSDDRAM